MSSFSTPVLPPHVKSILITGAGGFVGSKAVGLLLDYYPDLKIVATDVRPPPVPAGGENRVRSLGVDLGDDASISQLFEGESFDAVMALHGIMSGGSEADFHLGYTVNVDSHVSLLKAVTKHQQTSRQGKPLPIYVYTSSQAVYGGPQCLPEVTVDPETTPLYPESSYGVAKQIVELYVYDYTRKGFIDGRVLRLPTVTVRGGVPSSAASSFMSGLIREPLKGLRSDCPVADSIDDPNIDSLGLHLTSVKMVMHNILFSLTVPAEKFPAHSRSVNVPGITVSTRDILEALVTIGGKEKLDLIDFKRNATVLGITAHWPGGFKADAALAMGFSQDDPKSGFLDACKAFKEELAAKGELA